jgi:HSP20 family protein
MVEKTQVAKTELRHVPAYGETFNVFGDLHDEMNKLFDRFLHRDPLAHFGFPSRMKAFDWSPTVDVAERDDAYEITAELPGADDKDVHITLDGGVLTISGEKKAERKQDTKDVHFTGRKYGSFQRSFALPDDADEQRINADFSKGVLKVTIGRSKQAKNGARQIAIKAS